LETEADKEYKMTSSGYRKFVTEHFELLFDCGKIGLDYQPGHAHSDVLSFELYSNNCPFIVDTGTSTYENNSRRHLERSTGSHNTVQVGKFEQNEIWASHRVGRRGKITLKKDTPIEVIAEYTGYCRGDYIHRRTLNITSLSVVITDEVFTHSSNSSTAFFHFHPDVIVSIISENELKTSFGKMNFEGSGKLLLKEYFHGPEFNKLISSKVAEVEFQSQLRTTILF
jgi:uncharacterized heparinase superfamily protein